MLALINANRLRPAIAPIGLEAVAGAAVSAGIQTTIIDLSWCQDASHGALATTLATQFRDLDVQLVGVTMRNVDDCFWPSATSFVSQYLELVQCVRQVTDAPIVVGGVGFSVFARQLTERLGVNFGIRGDGEQAIVELYRHIDDPAAWPTIPGLIWSESGVWHVNAPDWSHWKQSRSAAAVSRTLVNNPRYFAVGGQIGIETKRGCPRKCIYCADPIAKGTQVRCKSPECVADECEALLAQGIDVLHICDGEFNVPRAHALSVCEELARRGLGEKLRYYAYLAVRPFDRELAVALRRSGCVGINFTGDSGNDAMLLTYRASHRKRHLEDARRICKEVGITCMIDLLLGGPGETPGTLRETIDWLKHVDPDCVGAGLGMRLYPGTQSTQLLGGEAALEGCPGILRRYAGPIDLVQPTFYVAPTLGSRPAQLVREAIAGDARFFPPNDEFDQQGDDHNYSDNQALTQAIARGARGAYWDILRQLS
jgi:hypothetical protein